MINLIICLKSHLQFVGETIQKFNGRQNFHNKDFKNSSGHGNFKTFCDHFNADGCKGANYQVQITFQ